MKSRVVSPSAKVGFFISINFFKQNGQPTGLLKYQLPFLIASCDDPNTPRKNLFPGSGKNGHPGLWIVWLPLIHWLVLIKYFSVIFWIRISFQFKLKNHVHPGLNKQYKNLHGELLYRNNSPIVTWLDTFGNLVNWPTDFSVTILC